MNKKRFLHFGIIIFICGFLFGMTFSLLKSQQENSFKYLDQFHFLYRVIQSEYVENVSPKTLFRGAMRGMLQSLNDPYSRFLDETDYADFKGGVTGRFTGIGVELTIKNDAVVVISPIEDSPAHKSGIRSGDTILQLNGTQVKSDNYQDLIKDIRDKNSQVSILIKREGFDEPIEFKIDKAPIKIKSIKSGFLKEHPGIGYIRITHFYAETGVEFEKALKNLSTAKKIIIDLRDNPGGDFETSISMADMLLPKGKVITTTRGKEGTSVGEEFKSLKDPLYSADVFLLVNSGSASSSEVFSGALKDNGRAKLIGQKTFGKALVQRIVDIEENTSGFTITMRKYYTPSGTMIHKKGIEPDFAVELPKYSDDDKKNLSRVFNDGILENFAKSKKKYTKDTAQEFLSLLESKNLKVSPSIALFYLKKEINKTEPSPLYDLEFDSELNKAIALAGAK